MEDLPKCRTKIRTPCAQVRTASEDLEASVPSDLREVTGCSGLEENPDPQPGSRAESRVPQLHRFTSFPLSCLKGI